MLTDLLLSCWITFGLLIGAGLLHLIPRLGQAGERLSDACCRAPLLDVIVFYFTFLPLIVGPLIAGWPGLLSAVLAQLATLLTWQTIHEALHREAMKGPRILRSSTRSSGLFAISRPSTLPVLPYPSFGFSHGRIDTVSTSRQTGPPPRLQCSDWISVSRQKFSGLVGHDLIWCLYCDWMTGVWSLGTEMLRNVESLWCPIRFACDKKCANCAIDFPDVNNGWVHASGT